MALFPARQWALQVRCARATDPRIAVSILPGLCQADPPDVMRGEETQIAGYLAENPHFDDVVARTQVVLVIGCSTSDLDT